MRSPIKKPDSALGSVIELVVIVAVALGLALGIQAFLVKPYRIPSESMVPTLIEGQRVLVNRIGHSFSEPSVGDIVVFHPPKGAGAQLCGPGDRFQVPDQPCDRPGVEDTSTNFIKRVVAGPGDTLEIRDGFVYRNGEKAEEDEFIRPCSPGNGGCTFTKEITIPAGHYFMMGDNRGASDDSRYWGPVPNDWIIGGAFATYWPPKRLGLF